MSDLTGDRTSSKWPKMRLGDVSVLIKDGTHGTHPRQETGIPLLSAKNITKEGQIYWDHSDSRVSQAEYDSIHRTYEIEPNDLLITVVGSLGRRAIVEDQPRFTIQRSVAVVRSDPTLVFPPYLFHAAGSDEFTQQLVRRANATAQAGVYLGELSSTTIPLPSLPEQRRIAEILDTVDEAIQQTEALIAKLKQIKTGLLHDLLTRGIDEHGQLRDPVAHPEQFKDSPLGRIPREWEVIRVREAGEVKLGRQRAPKYQTGTYSTPYLRVANVFDGWIDYSDILTMDFTPSEREIYSLRSGDILLNEGQSLELVGRSAVYRGNPGIYCFQNTLVRFRSNSTTHPEFARSVFKYFLDTGKFAQIAKQTTSVAHLGADRFANMLFPLPSLREQGRLANLLQSSDQRRESEEAYMDNLKLLKIGLMNDLLTGRVRVNEAERAIGAAP